MGYSEYVPRPGAFADSTEVARGHVQLSKTFACADRSLIVYRMYVFVTIMHVRLESDQEIRW
jgi:hypothetical protein